LCFNEIFFWKKIKKVNEQGGRTESEEYFFGGIFFLFVCFVVEVD
jgi:hypothetical protein